MTGNGARWLPEPDAVALLDDYGIPYPDHAYARSVGEAAEAAERIGYPVVLKVVSPDLIHKSDLGGVSLGIETAEGVREAYEGIRGSVLEHAAVARISGVLVCKQAAQGLEVIVGGLQDAMLGPAVMFGLGGTFAEVLQDVSFRIVPLQRTDASDMIQEIRGYPLLEGTRGRGGCDIGALIDLLLAVSRLMGERTDIKELDLNPVRVYEQGLMALDARILLAESE